MGKSRIKPGHPIPLSHRPHTVPVLESAGSSSVGSQLHRGRKGKQRERFRHGGKHVRINEPLDRTPKAWFLDVASPTWEDLRAIGKLLHLHPLTLEDILQQDPREKLDIFPKLGYYFISFRAIESRQVRETSQRQMHKMNDNLEPVVGHTEDAVGEANVYLVVSKEGICCFHYTDVTEHTDRVRNRLTMFEEIVSMSSDWIAHGILDSIVDSFFPYLYEIEKEAMAIEGLVYSPTPVHGLEGPAFEPKVVLRGSPHTGTKDNETSKQSLEPATETISLEKPSSITGNVRPRFAAPQWTLPLVLRRVRRLLGRRRVDVPFPSESPPSATLLTLRRMARVRRLVTSLNRLLASKSDIITQIRKRLLKAGTSQLGNETGKDEELEVAIYMGDIQDHILTLQQSLAHYETMLSKSHPAYLSQLQTLSAKKRPGKTFIYLGTVSVVFPCTLIIIGVCSLNVQLPTDIGTPVFHKFGIVITLDSLIAFGVLALIRYWWVQAGLKRRNRSKL